MLNYHYLLRSELAQGKHVNPKLRFFNLAFKLLLYGKDYRLFHAKMIVASILFFSIIQIGQAQITLFYEDFSSYADGTIAGPNWYVDATDCDDASPNEGLGISAFGVWNGRFTVNDSEGAPCCPLGGGGDQNYLYFTNIDVSGYCSFRIHFLINAVNSDCDFSGWNPHYGCEGDPALDDYYDVIIFEYQLDGGPWMFYAGSCSGFGVTGGSNPLNQHNTMNIRISMSNNADDEYYYLEYVSLLVTPPPPAYFWPIGPFCENAPPYLLPTTDVQGFTGTWDIGPTFDPAGLAGTTTTIIFTPDPQFCALPDTLEIEVLPAFDPDISPIGPFCSDDAPYPLQTNFGGYTGSWTGPGVVGNDFVPGQANIGANLLTYHSSHCSAEDTTTVFVGDFGPIQLGNATICSSEPPLDLTMLQDPDFPNGTWSGSGVLGSSFDPNGLSGFITLTFTSTDPCPDPATVQILVNTSYDEPNLGVANICDSDPPFNLNQIGDPTFPNATWSGPGVTGQFFNPNNLNGPITLTFNPNAPCAQSGTTTINVSQFGTLQLGSASLCVTDPIYDLSQISDPNYPTGTWSGLGVSGNVFDPGGLSGNIPVTFTPPLNCVAPATTYITVNLPATLQLSVDSICEGDSPLNLSTLADPLFPTGNWSGPGVLNGSFNPSGLSGSIALNFIPTSGCALPASTTVTVTSSAIPQLETVAICESATPLDLSLIADPTFPNGTWSGLGVSGNSFDPSGQSGNVSLSFSPSANCAEAAMTTVTVNQVPTISGISEDCNPSNQTFAVSFDIDGGTAPFTVNGSPIGSNSFTSGSYPNGSSYSFNLNDAAGCGPVQVSGTVSCGCLPSSYQLNETLCVGESLVVNGTVYNESNPSGTETLVGQNAQGCDSTVSVNLNFVQEVQMVFSQTLCPGESLTVNGIVFNESNPTGSITFPNGSYLGCDSTVTVILGFWTASTSNFNPTICTGGSVTVNGSVYNEANPSGVETVQAGSVNGCDSTIFVSLNFSATVQENVSLTLCPGLSFSVNGTVFNEANPNGSVTIHNGSFWGCDSIVNVALNFIQGADTTLLVASTCNPSEAGVSIQNLFNGSGCDSTVITTTTLASLDTTFLFSKSCDPSQTGQFTNTFNSTLGCDSVVVVTISLAEADTTLLFDTSCDPFSTGVFYQNLTNSEGCDSTIVTIVNYSLSDTTLLSSTTCDANSAGVFTENFVTWQGCDSLVILTVNYSESDTVYLSGTTCDPSQTGVFVQQLNNVFGCDSVVVTAVELLPSSIEFISSTTCDPFAAGTFEHHYFNQFGCDSLVSQTIALVLPDTSLITLGTCDPVQVGVVFETLQNQFGCDSVVQTLTNLLPVDACSVGASLASLQAHCDGTGGSVSVTVTIGQGPFGYEILQSGILVASGNIADIGQTVTVGDLQPGNYQVVISSANGTSTSLDALIGQELAPDLNILATSNYNGSEISCQGGADGSAEAIGNGGVLPYSFLWSNGSVGEQVSGLAAGIYLVTLTDGNDCSTVGQVSLNEPSPLEIGLTVNNPDCFVVNGGLIIVEPIGGTPPYQYALNEGGFTSDNGFSGLSSGIYHIDVLDANGCGASSVVLINAPVPLDVDLGDDIKIQQGDGATLNALVNIAYEHLASVTWSGIEALECSDCLKQQVFPIVTTSYKVKVIDENGCEAEDDITVYVDRRRQVYVPNAFSPNQDGINDVFTIYIKPGTVKKVKSFLVFSRWGETVYRYENFEPNDPASGWDGTHRGEPLNPAVFTWFATLEFNDGSTELFKGDVNLIR